MQNQSMLAKSNENWHSPHEEDHGVTAIMQLLKMKKLAEKKEAIWLYSLLRTFFLDGQTCQFYFHIFIFSSKSHFNTSSILRTL